MYYACRLGRRHPQALVYPLSVALLSPKEDRRVAAEALMATLQQHNATLVSEVFTPFNNSTVSHFYFAQCFRTTAGL
jgi:phosphatidylinositol kinase/protein kinase (PI-3  family)